MNETKVVKLQILPSDKQIQYLLDTMKEYTRICNVVSQWIFENSFEISHHKVNAALYHTIRKQSTLTSRLVQDTFRTVCARYKAVQTQMSKTDTGYVDTDNKKIHKTLEWLWKPINFKSLQCDLTRDLDYSFIDGGKQISISTIHGRQKMPFLIGEYWEHYFDNTWKFGTAKLICRNRKWYIHIPATREIPDINKEQLNKIVGIDRGLRFLVTTYDGSQTKFISGKNVVKTREKFAKTRQNLQKHNTRYSRRRLKRIGQRENSWMTHINHTISKALVNTYGANTVFVLEDLKGVSFDTKNLYRTKQGKRELTSWSFYQLEEFLTYKAESIGSKVIKVSPRYTSQRCPKCGIIDKTQRKHNKHEYQCLCGYHSNDDRVGAMNIYQLGQRWINGEDNPKYTKTKTIAIAE